MAGLTQAAANPANTLRFLRILFVIMFAFLGLYLVAGEFIASPHCAGLPSVMIIGIATVACVVAAAVLILRFFFISRILSSELPKDLATSLVKLRQYYIICYVACEAVGLYGFFLRFLGASPNVWIPFFIGAAILFMLCRPQAPEVPGEPISNAQA